MQNRKRDTDVQNRLLDSVGEGEGDVQREQHWNKDETDHQPRMDAGTSILDKCSGLVHWDDPEGWDGEGGGRGDKDGEHM